MSEIQLSAGVILFILGISIGIVLGAIMVNTGKTEIVTIDALNQVCHIYGDGYEWYDNQPGAESSIVCRYEIKPIDRIIGQEVK